MKRTAKAHWEGNGLEGKGGLTTQSGVFNNQPYSFKTRFKNEDGSLGTNPEELIAAAHAGCFTMALSFQLANAGFTAESLNTEAVLTIEQIDGSFQITAIELKLRATVPGISTSEFEELALGSKANCPVSKVLSSIPITLTSSLID